MPELNVRSRRDGMIRAADWGHTLETVAAWLLATGRAASVDAALTILQQARPRVVLGPQHRQALARVSLPAELSCGA